MRRRLGPAAFSCAVAVVLCARPARATDCSGPLSPCIDDDVLWPHAGAGRFAAIGGTETVAPREIGFALVTSYLSRPIVLKVASPGGGGSDQYAVADQVDGTFLWSYGVTDRLELDAALPITFAQGGAGLSPITGGDGLKDTAVRDLRFGFAYALVPHWRADPTVRPDSALGRRNAWGLTARFEVSAPTGDRDQFAGERSAVFVPSVAADYRLGRLFAAAEVGARVRPTTELLGARVGSQVVAAVGAGVDVLPRELLAATLEAWALPTLVGQPTGGGAATAGANGSTLVPAEWQLAARTSPLRGGGLSIQLGGGGGIPVGGESAVTTPRLRVVLSLRWAPLARDTDRDGVSDAADACPGAPGGGTSDGCPGPAPTATEAHLGLSAAKDVCTDAPDLVDGFTDDDGCPDEDADKDGVDDRLDRCPLVPEDFAGLVDGCPEGGRP